MIAFSRCASGAVRTSSMTLFCVISPNATWKLPRDTIPMIDRAFTTCLLALTLFAVSAGCGEGVDYRPDAIGEEGTVTVVMDSSHWNGEVGAALRRTLGRYITTLPQPERAFNLKVRELDSQSIYNQIKKYKNVVFVAVLDDTTQVADFMRRRLSKKVRQAVQDGRALFTPRGDVWRQQQMVAYLTAQTAEELVQKIDAVGPKLRQTFNEATRRRQTVEMFEKGRQHALEDTLMQRHGFAVNVQHDYQIIQDTTTASGGFVYLRRVLPSTWRNLMIYYTDEVDPSTLSPSWIKSTRDSLTRQYVRGNVAGFMRIDYRDITSRKRLASEQINFLGRYGFEVRGVWTMVAPHEGDSSFVQLGMGGPFVSYGFYDRASGRLYLIDGAVFAPKFDKRDFLRQMEVIAYTFRTRQDVQSADTARVTASASAP